MLFLLKELLYIAPEKFGVMKEYIFNEYPTLERRLTFMQHFIFIILQKTWITCCLDESWCLSYTSALV